MKKIIDNLNITQEEKNKIIVDADKMLKGQYVFDGIWDMELFNQYVENKKTKWNIEYYGDIEWTYMYTRMGYLYKLILASEITDNKKYIKFGLKIIRKWNRDNYKYVLYIIGKANQILLKNKSYAYRTVDLSIMITNITDFILYCKENKYINNRCFNWYKRKIIGIIKYIVPKDDRSFNVLSNWRILESGNVLYCILKLGIKERYEETKKRFIRYINNQIIYNGSHIESSPMYLVQIILVLLKVLKYSKNDLYSEIEKNIRSTCDYIIKTRKLDNCIPNIGDSDLTNISDLMFVAGTLLKDDYFLKYIDRNINIEFCVKYGISNKKISISKNIETNNSLTQYRDQTVYKSFKEGTYLLCSNIPKKIEGHKHYDYMSIIYTEFGKDVLVDLGRYSYKSDKNRKFFVGPNAHNVINIINNKYYKYETGWISNQKIECYENRLIEDKNWINIKMSCVYGFSEVVIDRYVTYVYGIGLFITDIVSNNKSKDLFETYFNIGESFSVKKDKNITYISDDENTIYYLNDRNTPISLNNVKYSKKYNESINTKQITIKNEACEVTHCFLKKIKEIKVFYNEKNIEYYIDDLYISIKK